MDVRSLNIFGQRKAKSHYGCPKFEHLWTEENNIASWMSEVRAPSDQTFYANSIADFRKRAVIIQLCILIFYSITEQLSLIRRCLFKFLAI